MSDRVVRPANLPEFRKGRNFVRVGDRVHVRPSKPGRRDGWDTYVLQIRAVDGKPAYVDVSDKRGGRRTIPIERVERRAQTRNEKRD